MARRTGFVIFSIAALLLTVLSGVQAVQAGMTPSLPTMFSGVPGRLAAPSAFSGVIGRLAAPSAFSGVIGRLAAPSASRGAAVLAANPLSVTALAGGFEHTCALVAGVVYCWGSNRNGQLGDSQQTIHPFPIPVSGLTGTVNQIAAGGYHTCALKADGTVWCWGSNSKGQLGSTAVALGANSTVPVQVTGLTNVTWIATGYDYTCAITTGGVGQCWGNNASGQLGSGTTTSSPTPVIVSGLTGATKMTGSYDHTCALKTDGTVWCWGRNTYGELGNGGSTLSATPVAVSLPAGVTVTAVSAGSQHTCLMTSAGAVYCWGEGSLGQIGDGKNSQINNTPQLVSGLTAQFISAGGYSDTGHTCAVTSTNGVMCWGSNVLGQLGDGSTTDRGAPVANAALTTGVLSVSAGINHTCALLSDHTVQCWGSDSSGQLGDGVNSVSALAVDTSRLGAGVTHLGTGEQNTCAVVNGSVMCWGNNRNMQIGDGSHTNRPLPTTVSGLGGAAIDAVDSGTDQTCVIQSGGVKCWGQSNPTPVSVIPANSGVTRLAVANLHACAVVNGAAMCWGDNRSGQLGNGLTATSTTPVQVSGLVSGVKDVAVGQWFSCAVLDTGEARCWGDNTSGQLGNTAVATGGNSLTPVQVIGLTNASELAAGQDHTCALTTGGAVLCWGNNQQGQLGDGTQTLRLSPTPVSGISGGATKVTAGGYHTCALVNGGVRCWGYNSFGQLGNGLTTFSKIPVSAAGLGSGVIDVSAGGVFYDEEHTCAVTTGQGLKCWGGNEYGQLGDNLPILRTTPVRVLGLADGPEIGQNYTTGKTGSYFRLAVAKFPAGAHLSVFSDTSAGHLFMGTITTTAEGYAIFHILLNANPGASVQVSVTPSAAPVAITLAIASGNPLHLQEGAGPVYAVSPMSIYLPFIMH